MIASDCLCWLLEAGARPNALSVTKRSSLHLACGRELEEVACLLVRAGAELYVGVGGTDSPMSLLRRKGGSALELLRKLDEICRQRRRKSASGAGATGATGATGGSGGAGGVEGACGEAADGAGREAAQLEAALLEESSGSSEDDETELADCATGAADGANADDDDDDDDDDETRDYDGEAWQLCNWGSDDASESDDLGSYFESEEDEDYEEDEEDAE